MCRSDVDNAAPVFRFHPGNRGARAVKYRRQIDGDNRVPFFRRKFINRCHKLDARVVHQYVDCAQRLLRIRYHCHDLGGLTHIGTRIGDRHRVLCGESGTDAFDFFRVAKTVQHHVRTFARERARNA